MTPADRARAYYCDQLSEQMDRPVTLGYRVYATWGSNWCLVGQADDRIGYLALCERAYRDGANETWIDKVVASSDGQEKAFRIFTE